MAVDNPTQEFNNPTCTAASFGRFFYGVGSNIYFTQVFRDSKDIGRCYQTNDPTSEEIPDLLDTDGGYIILDGAINIQYLQAYRSGIVVFAENGVWYIYNPDGGFKATAFNVTKISERGIRGIRSIVLAEGSIFYFATNGIMQLVANEFDNLQAQDITEQSIRSHYLEFFFNTNAKGIYNESNKQIEWWTPDAESRGLVLDLSLQAFYPQKNASSKRIATPISIQNTQYYPVWEYDGQLEYGLAQSTNTEFKDFGIDTEA